MLCEVCKSAEPQPRLIRYHLSDGDRLIVIEHVPAKVCPNCGQESFSPQVVQRIHDTVWQQRPPARLIEAAVYEYADQRVA